MEETVKDDENQKVLRETGNDLRQVQGIHRQIDNREKLHTVGRKTGEVARSVSEVAKSGMEGEGNEAVDGQRQIRRFSHPASSILGDMTDGSRKAEILRRAEIEHQKCIAGDYFFQQGKTNRFDFDNITTGDLEAYQKLRKNPTMDRDKIDAIRYAPDKQERAGLKNQKERKQLLELKKSVGINAYEESVRDFATQNPDLFTDKQRKMVLEENAMFRFQEKGCLKANQEVLNIYTRHLPDAGSFKDLRLQDMSAKDIKGFLLRKDKLRAVQTGGKFYRPTGVKFEQCGYAQLTFHETTEKFRHVGVGGKRTHLGSDVYNSLGLGETELDGTVRTIRTMVRSGTTALRLGKNTGVTAVKTAHKTVELTGRLTVWSLEKAGKKETARAIAGAGHRINEAEQSVVQTARAVKEAPAKMVNKAVSAVGKKARETKVYKAGNWVMEKVKGTKVYQGAKRANAMRKKAGHVVAAPVRLIGRLMDFVKKKLLLPFMLGAGGIFLILIIVSAVGGSSGSSGSTMVLILDTEEHFKDFQAKYEEYDAAFIKQVDSIINGTAQTTNKKGQAVRYGVNGSGNSEGNANEDYSLGVTLHYTYDGSETAGISSNIEDCLSVLAVMMQQQQEAHHAEAVELLEALYKSSHSYNFIESALYPCTSGCETTHYVCSEKELNYLGSDLRFMPWQFGEVYKPTASQECVVCKGSSLTYAEYAGCTVTGTCLHGEEGNLGETPEGCSNHTPVYECPGHDYDNTWTDEEGNEHGSSGTDYCSDAIGCEGYYQCEGHEHFGCPTGHDLKTCYGHVDLTMNVNIASLSRLTEMGGGESSGE